MTTYYVSQSGSNGDGLSLATAKTTYAAGKALLSAGDTLLINNGTYNEALDSPPSGVSNTQRTIIQAINRLAVTFNGATSSQAYVCAIENKNWITIDGFILDSVNAVLGVTIGDSRLGLGGVGSTFITLQNCEVKNATEFTGISFHNSGSANNTNILIKDCLVHDHGTAPTTVDGFEGHGIYPTFNNSIVEGCTIYNCGLASRGGFAIHQFGETGPRRHNNIYRSNRIFDCAQGILINWGDNCLVYNNLVYECGTHVEGAGAIRASSVTSHTSILNNTVANNGDGGVFVASGASSTVVKNNISYNNGTNYSDSGSSTTHLSNLEGVNPLFVDAAGGDFRLQQGSPAIDTALDLSSIFVTDFFGNARV